MSGQNGLKITCDVGGTFTDVVVSEAGGDYAIGKSLTTPSRLADGLQDAIAGAARQLGLDLEETLGRTDLFVYATTQATNAVLEGKTARTALLCTEGFPDVLVRREGGSLRPYDYDRSYPEPYVPRRLTFEIPERIGSEGEVVVPLDVAAAERTLARLAALEIEAVGVSLFWSIANPVHELELGRMIEAELPGVPFTLSHRLNPIVREYRRTSSAVIDASLKPLMQQHLAEVEEVLRGLGYAGQLYAANSLGGMMRMSDLVERPIQSVRSGPALAPVAGRALAAVQLDETDVVVCDTGGTSFDVSLIHDGDVVTTRETWLGEQFAGHLTGLSAVDARSVGAGGGSIAWVDSGGLLRVGPDSAGADPGPACYGNGGERPTVTDAAVVLGYLDPDHFLGGEMKLDADAARAVIESLATDSGAEGDVESVALAVVTIANEHMVAAIKEITINQGIDPRDAALVAGGGAAGLGIAAIAAELGCRRVLVPRCAGALSAFGGQQADVVAEAGRTLFAGTRDFDRDAVNGALDEIDAELAELAASLSAQGVGEASVEHIAEARYAHQVWDLEIPLPGERFTSDAEVERLEETFNAEHLRVFAVEDPGQTVEVSHWKGRLTAAPAKPPVKGTIASGGAFPRVLGRRDSWFPGTGSQETPVYEGGTIPAGDVVEGPALIAEPTTTVVVPPGASLSVTAVGDYLLEAV
ncbi:MAG: hydantoinase/oxoprolinase family protein [Solirubrobacterales bacterium]